MFQEPELLLNYFFPKKDSSLDPGSWPSCALLGNAGDQNHNYLTTFFNCVLLLDFRFEEVG
jgi:hypothetical protein